MAPYPIAIPRANAKKIVTTRRIVIPNVIKTASPEKMRFVRIPVCFFPPARLGLHRIPLDSALPLLVLARLTPFVVAN